MKVKKRAIILVGKDKVSALVIWLAGNPNIERYKGKHFGSEFPGISYNRYTL